MGSHSERSETNLLAFVCIAACGALAVRTVDAADLAYGLGYGLEHDTNVTLSSQDAREEWINSPLAGFGYRENGAVLAADARVFAQYNDYRKQVYPNGPLYYADARGLWTVSPQRFTWTAQDYYRELQPTATTPATPGNRVGANVFSTGPDLYLRQSTETLQLGVRYGNYSVQHGTADNQRYEGYARWLHDLSDTAMVSLNYEGSKVDFRDTLDNTDFSRQNLYAGAVRLNPTSNLRVDAGSSRISYTVGGSRDRGLLHANWMYLPTTDSVLGLRYRAEYSDPGSEIISMATVTTLGTTPPPPDPLAIFATGNVFYVKETNALYGLHAAHLGGGINAMYRDSSYETDHALDNRADGAHAEISYFQGIDFAATLHGDYVRTKYPALARTDHDRIHGIRFLYRLTQRVVATLDVSRMERSSTDPTAKYTNNQVLLSLFYASAPWLVRP